MKRLIVISIIVVATIFYRVLFCGTVMRINLKGMNENIRGVEYTTVNILNPLKSQKVKRAINEAYVNVNMQKHLPNDEKMKYIYGNLKIEGFEILDLYNENNEVYAFVKFPTKENDHAINKLLFVLDRDYKVKSIDF